MLFENNGLDLDFLSLNNLTKDFKNDDYNSMNSKKLENAKNGFLKGNMFVNEYLPPSLSHINKK